MAIPPVKRFDQGSSDIQSKEESSRGDEPQHFLPIVERQIEQIAFERKVKVQHLSAAFREIASSFLAEHAELERFILDLRQNKHELNELEKLEAELERRVSAFKGKYNQQGFDETLLEIATGSQGILDIKFQLEVSKNIFINRLIYIDEVSSFIKDKKTDIVKEFGLPEHQSLKEDEIDFKVKVVSSETHNSGKAPAFIEFYCKGSLLFKIVYKPRDAEIDRQVINTFQKINQLTEKSISQIPLLPIYKIICYRDRSLWEFVEGKSIGKANSVGIYISQTWEGSKKKRAIERLDRMDAILTELGISDLHKENVIVRSLPQDEVEFVPIDLENRQKGHPTQLGGHPANVELTEAELKIVKESEYLITSKIISRYLPLSTHVMAGLIGSYSSTEKLASLISKQMEKDGFVIVKKQFELEALLLRSVLNQDVPYFTELNNTIYYGMPTEGQEIAKRGVSK